MTLGHDTCVNCMHVEYTDQVSVKSQPRVIPRGENVRVFAWLLNKLWLGAIARSEIDPHVRHILSWRLGHENISTAILPLPLIQEEQLSDTGGRMCSKYW